jgi:hypothetical protein
MGALICEVPLQAEIAFMPGSRVRGNDRNKERAVVDLAPDLLIPGVPAAQLTLVEPDLNAGCSQCRANPLSGLRILRGVAQKHRVRWLSHNGPPPNKSPEGFSPPP